MVILKTSWSRMIANRKNKETKRASTHPKQPLIIARVVTGTPESPQLTRSTMVPPTAKQLSLLATNTLQLLQAVLVSCKNISKFKSGK